MLQGQLIRCICSIPDIAEAVIAWESNCLLKLLDFSGAILQNKSWADEQPDVSPSTFPALSAVQTLCCVNPTTFVFKTPKFPVASQGQVLNLFA